MNEKRKHIRTEFSGNVRLIHESFGELTVEMRDLSDGGIFLYVQDDVTVPVGTVVEVQSLDLGGDLPNFRLRCHAFAKEMHGIMTLRRPMSS